MSPRHGAHRNGGRGPRPCGPPPARRVETFTRDEIGNLVRAAYRGECGPPARRPAVHLARLILVELYACSRASMVEKASFEPDEGGPWFDLDRGRFFRLAERECRLRDMGDPEAEPPLIPLPLLEHVKLWRKNGARRPVERSGRPVACRPGFRRLAQAVLGPERARRASTALRWTGAAWLHAADVDRRVVALFLSHCRDVTEEEWCCNRPLPQEQVHHAFARAKAAARGRGR